MCDKPEHAALEPSENDDFGGSAAFKMLKRLGEGLGGDAHQRYADEPASAADEFFDRCGVEI